MDRSRATSSSALISDRSACAVEFNRLAEWVVPVRGFQVFKTGALNHSATLPSLDVSALAGACGRGKHQFRPGRDRPGVRCRDPAFVYSTERESQQARTQQHQACRGQCEESVRDNVVVAHDTPTTPDARPNLLKISKFPIGTTESFAQLEFGRTPEPLAVRAHALER